MPRLSLSFRCPLDWNTLEGEGSVRHCATCERDVPDLDGLSAAQLGDWYRQQEGPVCARVWVDVKTREVVAPRWDVPNGRAAVAVLALAIPVEVLEPTSRVVEAVEGVAVEWASDEMDRAVLERSRLRARLRVMGEIRPYRSEHEGVRVAQQAAGVLGRDEVPVKPTDPVDAELDPEKRIAMEPSGRTVVVSPPSAPQSLIAEDCADFIEAGQWGQAKLACRLAAAEAPDDPEVAVRRGLALFEVYEVEAAVVQLVRALELGSSDPRARTHLVAACQDLGAHRGAAAFLRARLAEDPDARDAPVLREALLACEV